MSKPITREREDLRDELTEARAEIATLKAEAERLNKALQEIVREGDYTAPEGMKRIAKDALMEDNTDE